MSKILYYDCFAGISGDMHLAALLDLGADRDYVLAQLNGLHLSGWKWRIEPGQRGGLNGLRLEIICDEETVARHWRDIRLLLEQAELDEGTRRRALAIFLRLAEAEAKVHDVSVDCVHFHEVGGLDAILDIVGAAAALESLRVDRVLCSRVELGGGWVRCTHGLLPVPAPAVVELLRDAPVSLGAVDKETTTPTGAAILAASVDEFIRQPCFLLRRCGHGLGRRDLVIPNLLRACLGESWPETANSEMLCLVECNLDDMNPEWQGYLLERLLAVGALDAWLTPLIMKKSRPAVGLSALCPPALEKNLLDVLWKESTTLGVRVTRLERRYLDRREERLKTRHGEVRIKLAYQAGRLIKWKAEYEDCKRLAEETGLSPSEIQEDIQRAFLERNQRQI